MFILVHSPRGNAMVINSEVVAFVFTPVLVDSEKNESTVTRIILRTDWFNGKDMHLDCAETVEYIEQALLHAAFSYGTGQ